MAIDSSDKQFSSRPKEPTREQIKEAFKETIERWEKIVEDPGYYNETKCKLCMLENDKGDYQQRCNDSCPVRNFEGAYHHGCACTPYGAFFSFRTSANALAELNFLRKVYIWWMEKEANKIWEKHGMDKPSGVVRKEEKKEEWEDVTQQCTVHLNEHCSYYYFQVFYENREILFTQNPNVILEEENLDDGLSALTPFYDKPTNIKVELSHGNFRILKKI